MPSPSSSTRKWSSLPLHLRYQPRLYTIPITSFLIQMILIAYGKYQDEHMQVKYTDVDYRVFSDAVELIWGWKEGDGLDRLGKGWLTRKMGWRIGDPYDRATFRYTPLLPLLLSPMAIPTSLFPLAPYFGKILFSFLTSFGVHRLLMEKVLLPPGKGHPAAGPGSGQVEGEVLRSKSVGLGKRVSSLNQRLNGSKQVMPVKPSTASDKPDSQTSLYSPEPSWLPPTLLWTLNPIILNISTRGSSESILVFLVLLTLVLLKKQKMGFAGMVWAIAVGWKIYPVVFGVGILSWVIVRSREREKARERKGKGKRAGKFEWMRRQGMRELVTFGVASAGTFVGVTFILWSIWGYPFIHHSYLYHIHRLDHRHNFSPYFYPIYLSLYSSSKSSTSNSSLPINILSSLSTLSRHPLASFIPQASLTLLAGAIIPWIPSRVSGGMRSDGNLEMTLFTQTWLFVMFNKVCTSQYFLWFIFLLPPIIPRLQLSLSKAIVLVSLWIGAQAIWLSIAYRLEFLGESVFLPLWVAGVGFLAVNSYIIGELLKAYG